MKRDGCMMKRRTGAIILGVLAALSLCGCGRKNERPPHTPNTYPPDETVVFDIEATEADARLVAEQLCDLGEGCELACDGEDYVHGGEAMLYSAVSGDTTYRIAVNYVGDRYVYSEKEGDFITECLWLYEKSGVTRESVVDAAAACWNRLNPDSTNEVTATGTILYSIPGADGPAFEAWVLNEAKDAKISTFAVMPDLKTVYTEGDSGFVPFEG